MRLNVALYRVMAYVTGVVLIVLCILAIMQIFVHDEAAVNVVGTIHGALYIVYLLVAFPLTRRLRLTAGPTVAVLLAQAAANLYVTMTLGREGDQWKIRDLAWRETAPNPNSVAVRPRSLFMVSAANPILVRSR